MVVRGYHASLRNRALAQLESCQLSIVCNPEHCPSEGSSDTNAIDTHVLQLLAEGITGYQVRVVDCLYSC
jgi:hypothetical protein